MAISTALLFSRAVGLMQTQQTELASLQEKVSTGKELVRPSDSPDLAVNIARIKATIGEMDAYKNSLNAVNDRLTIEESYITGVKDVLIKLKQLTIQAANGAISNSDRQVIGLEMEELVSEAVNLANGTDANGNFLFSGSRVATPPYQMNEDKEIEYAGDTFRPNIDYTSNRRSPVGRNGPDVFTPILSGGQVAPVPGKYRVDFLGTHETDDSYTFSIGDYRHEASILPGETRQEFSTRLARELNELAGDGQIENASFGVEDGSLLVTFDDGLRRTLTVQPTNGADQSFTFGSETQNGPDGDSTRIVLTGTPERGDLVTFSVGLREVSYAVTGDESDPLTTEAVALAVRERIMSSGLFEASVDVATDPDNLGTLTVSKLRPVVGDITLEVSERRAINDQGAEIVMLQEPIPTLPERVEFFKALGSLVKITRGGDQDQIQGTLHQLDQMLDTVTLSLADIGAEMSSIADEIDVNENLTVELKAALSSEEDLDFTTAITKLQARMMSLEAAQSSFAKISQLSIFDYLR